MATLLDQLYKTKLQLIAVVAGIAGIAMMILAKWPPMFAWLATLPFPVPLGELGSTVFATGLLAVFFEYVDRKHGEQRIRDALLDSLAFNPDTLKDIASPDALDRIATNALGLRLKDQALAGEVYADLRNQVIRAPERWHDVDVSVSLAPWESGPATGRGSMFEATIRWEYRVLPASTTMRFACVSDLAEYRDMLRDQAIASAWHFDPSAGTDVASQDVFELLQLTVDGKPRKIRRTQRAGSQLYTVSLGSTATTDGRLVTVAYTYRVLVQRHGHLLYLDLPRPTRGLHVQLDYANAGIRRVNVLDFIASSEDTRVEQTPQSVPARTIDIGFDGWIFPRSGVAFVWVLPEEIMASSARRATRPA